MNKPNAPACERNREPILSVIKPLFSNCRAVLEIGSGTGQHAVYFAEHMPHLVWYPSDCEEYHRGIAMWVEDTSLDNIRMPLELDVSQEHWPEVEVDAVFTANTLHIMGWEYVKDFFYGVGKLLLKGGLLTVYGPVNYNNEYTSSSNAQFDTWLKNRDPLSGIRNFEDLDELARQAGLEFKEDFAMPANNRMLCWAKI